MNPIVRVRNLNKSFHRGSEEIRVLTELNVDVAEGEFLALMGPSGSGKTTLLNLIAGLDQPSAGSILVGDQEISRMSESQLARWRTRHVGFIFQFYHLLPVLTAYENIELPLLLLPLTAAQRRRQVQNALDLVGLTDRQAHRPGMLSGGQQQRVGIARAFVTDPTLIVADEPTGDLDSKSAGEILDLLSLLRESLNKTIVMVTHDPHSAERAQRLLHLEKGRLVEDTTRAPLGQQNEEPSMWPLLLAQAVPESETHYVRTFAIVFASVVVLLYAIVLLFFVVLAVIDFGLRLAARGAEAVADSMPRSLAGTLVGVPKFALIMLKNLRRNLVRSSLMFLATFVLVIVITLVWSVLSFLENVTSERAANIKILVTEKYQVPSRMPPRYAKELTEKIMTLPAGSRPNPETDIMTWSFVGAAIDLSKRSRETDVFFAALNPDVIGTMLDDLELNNLAPADRELMERNIAKLKANRQGVLFGYSHLQGINKSVGDRVTVHSFNYKDIDLELDIVGILPRGRYDTFSLINKDYFEGKLDEYERSKGKKHPMADKALNLYWARLPDKQAMEQFADIVAQPGNFASPALKVELGSSAIATFIEPFKDIIWGCKYLFSPACLVTMTIVIANGISIGVRERRPEMAVMKVLGFRPWQILLLVLGEALLVGALAGGLATGLAWLGINARGGLQFPIAFFGKFKIPDHALWWGPLLGAGAALIGSFLPAWSARTVKVWKCLPRLPRGVGSLASVPMQLIGNTGARAPGWYDVFVRPSVDFMRRFTFVVLVTPLFVAIALMPLTVLLLAMPLFLPDEAVIADVVAPTSGWRHRAFRRAVALLIGLAALVALVFSASELVRRLGLTGILAWQVGILVVYLSDALILIGLGQVPLRYNYRNLLVRWTHTMLTAIAFTVVVALLTVLLAFVNGMYKVTEDTGQPGNVVIIADGATDEAFSTLAYGDADMLERERATLDAMDRPLPAPIGVKRVKVGGRDVLLTSRETFAIVNQPVPEEKRRRFVQVRGIVEPELAGAVHDLALAEGRWFSAAGVQTPSGAQAGDRDMIEAVLGTGVAGVLAKSGGKTALTLGDTFELGDRTWVIVGILASGGTAFGSEVWAKENIVAKLFNKGGYSSLIMRVEEADTRPATAARASALAYHLKNRCSNPKVNAQTELEYYSNQAATSKQFLVAIMVVAAVMAVGGVFGVMNTMFAAIAQRTKDIGVLRILGFKRWQILVSFLLESLTIALIGGVLGCLLGLVCDGWSATSSISSGQGGGKTVVLRLSVDALVLSCGLLFTLVMGRLGGLIPALSAMRLRILEAM